MSKYIVLTMTDASRLAMLDYQGNGLDVKFSHIGLGSGNYTANAQTESLQMKWADFPIISGFVDTDNHCLILTTMGQLNEAKRISEIGLYSDDGALFAVASLPQDYYFKTEPGCYFSFSVSVALDQKIEGQKIKLSFAPQELILQALLNLHLQHKNPHPQYIKFMRDMINAHLLAEDPHNQYVFKTDAELAIKKYIDLVDKLIKLYLSILGVSSYAGSFSAVSSNDVVLDGFGGNLINGHPILITPEGGHEAWSVARKEKQFKASIFNRSGQDRIGYSGRLNWLVLPVLNETPVIKTVIPELIDCGVLSSSGSIEVRKAANSNKDYNKAVFLMCPEGVHEGWGIGRSIDKFTASIFNRSGKNRVGYGGNVSYAVLDKKEAEKPIAYPGLLMSGVSEVGAFSIKQPIGAGWDFTNPNYVLLITPEGGHEAWGVSRTKDKINVSVYHRSGTDRVGYSGRVNWAIFMKGPEQNRKIYYAGKYEISIAPGQTIIVELFGAGAGGGASVYTGGNTNCPGDDGQNTKLTTASKSILAGGGLGGKGGWWGNGSHMSEGWGGEGGKNAVDIAVKDDILISIEENKDGPAGIVKRWSPQVQTEGYTAMGYPNSNYGGAGAWGIGDESRSGGGSGGAGGYIRAKLENKSRAEVLVDLEVGLAGIGWKKSGNHGSDGGEGFAVITFM